MIAIMQNDIVIAKVHGIPQDQVMARVLCIGETLIIVYVKWHGLSITSWAVDIISNVSKRLQQERVYCTISPAIMHWAFKPGGPLQRLLAVQAQRSFGKSLQSV